MTQNKENNNTGKEGYYILGWESENKKKRYLWWLWVVAGGALLAAAILIVVNAKQRTEMVQVMANVDTVAHDIWYNNTDVSLPSCLVVKDTVVDSLHLKILTPVNAVTEIHLGQIDTSETDILFAALAADLGRDKGKIVGAFVYAGEPLSWGLSKRGYCAIIDGNIALGVADDSPLFERATEQGGYFFRQYPAVDNGVMVENNPKNASFRRALCLLDGKVCIVVCTDRVVMNDFSSILVNLGVENAIYLVGSTEDGWYRTEDGKLSRLGKKYTKNNPNINYLVFRAQ